MRPARARGKGGWDAPGEGKLNSEHAMTSTDTNPSKGPESAAPLKLALMGPCPWREQACALWVLTPRQFATRTSFAFDEPFAHRPCSLPIGQRFTYVNPISIK